MSYSAIESPEYVPGSTHGTRRRSFKSDLHDDTSEETPLIGRAPHGQIIAPKDKWNIVRWSFLYLGMITMLPWNIMLSMPSFWDYKFRNVTLDALNSSISGQSDLFSDKPTEMQITFPSYLSIASNVPGAITTIAHSLLGQRACVRKRIFWSLAVFFASFGGLLVLSLPNSDKWQDRYLHTVILMVVLLNVGVNVLQGALFGVSGRFPSIYAGCVMTGQSLGGVLPAIAAILLTLFDVEPRVLGPVCFCLILVSILTAMVIFFGMSNNIYFLYYGEGKVSVDQDIDHNDEVDHICYKAIFKNSWMYFVTGYINYATTLSVFPAITSLVRSQVQTHWTRVFFTPVASVLLFNVGDLIGRTSATWLQWPGTKRFEQFTLMSVTILRIAFIPSLMLCNVDVAIRRHLFTLFHGDVTFCCFILALGISSGYIGNVSMLMIPKVNEVAIEIQAAATLMNSAVVLGIASGSTAGYFLQDAL
ncbi:equilibrative nucleoside transporter 3-like isoform X1 [Tigriopus californicus]|uniref:equilibrative nucleoside transporter 3-like isoform X1 n=1 Tax=Tigriopus californicus TaxID=6832 RepID=UPI0027DA2EF8|nr:equilibrative nucleoside transporter 3-like isoform X1 [Tigriopus californicus]